MRYRCRRGLFLKFLLGITFIYISLAIVTQHMSVKLIVRDVIYLTRPIWDNSGSQPENIIPHFHSETVPYSELCPLHGWKERKLNKSESKNAPKVIDAVMFSIELDMLEIRLRELWDVVDVFLVLETDKTFTGVTKPLYLEANMERFKFAAEKLRHRVVRDAFTRNTENSFENEEEMRNHMTSAIWELMPENGDLIIVSDVDEIPRKETIMLLKNCEGYASELHLQMRNYVYSFEFYGDTTNRPHVDTFGIEFRYHHKKSTESQISNWTLEDAGWHCSFCFRYLSDFAFKMTAFSHSDRVTAEHLLNEQNIQRKICDGSNIFDMFEEAYTFKELVSTLGKRSRKLSTVGIPSAVMDQHKLFRFLLPGGCIREQETPVK